MRPTFISFLFILHFTSQLHSQSPGGIAAANTLWLKADEGVTSNSSVVSQWQDFSSANVTGNFTVQPLNGTTNTQTGPTLIDAGINFNPYLRFDGSTNSLSSINQFPGTSLVSNSNVTIFQVFNLKGGIVWLKWETDQVGSTARLGFENAGGNIRFDFPKAVPASAGQNVGNINVLNKHSLSTVFADATSSVNRLNGFNNNTIAIPSPGNFAAVTDKLVLGNENLINLPAQIDLAEVIIYSSTLPLADRNKIESYLAVKYGFTLNQSAGSNNDYVASNGTIIWNQLANSGYGADITGIGRDDASGLSQKQSLSVNTSALVTLYHGNYSSGNFPLLNNANTNNFSTDRSFLLAGDNGLPITLTPCFFENKAQRMQRIWKVNNTNVGTVTVSIEQAAVASTVKNLIRSADPGFPAATTDIIPLIAANGKLYAEVNFSNNDYFSFSSDTMTVTLSPIQPVCTNPNSGSVTTTVSGGNPPFGYAWSPSGQVTANLINVNAGTYNLTVTQGSCQAVYPITLAAPTPPATPVVNPVSICPGNTATLNVQSPVAAQTYSWYIVANGGTALGSGTSFTTPTLSGNTTYYIETSSGSCTSNRVPVTVSITTITDAVVNNAVVCTGNAATLTIQNPVAAQTYNWYNTATGGTALGTGTIYTTVALTAATVFYVEALNNGCSHPRIPVNVTLDNVTSPQATGDTVCAGNVATLFINNPDASLNYSWYDAPNAGTLIGNGVSVTTPVVSSETDFYVEAYNGNCYSSRISVTVRLKAPLQTPVVATGTVTQNAVTFNWQGVPTAIGYQVSIDGGPFMNPSTGTTGLSHTVSGLNTSQTVSIEVIALGPPTACGNSAPGIAQATTYGSGFHMPTAFTPNRDLSNPVIRPQLPGGSQLLFFTIYNRWGQKVFNTRIDGAGWDGSLNGKSQPDGAYVWVCRYVFTYGRIIDERGSFLLLQ